MPQTPIADAIAAKATAPERARRYPTMDAFAADLLGEGEFCTGSALTLADLALASALLYLNLRQPERDWQTPHPQRALWLERMAARSALRASLGEKA